jgi:hypothetical protein
VKKPIWYLFSQTEGYDHDDDDDSSVWKKSNDIEKSHENIQIYFLTLFDSSTSLSCIHLNIFEYTEEKNNVIQQQQCEMLLMDNEDHYTMLETIMDTMMMFDFLMESKYIMLDAKWIIHQYL